MTLAGARCAIYARYSSDLQSGSSIEAQVERARRYAEERGAYVAAELVFVDAAISGATSARPGLRGLLAACDARRVDVVLVESFDRISRDQADLHPILRRWRLADVRAIGIGDGVDTEGKGATLAVGMRAIMAQAYLEDLADKTRRGLEARARAGLATGGVPFGYVTKPAPGGRAIEVEPAAAAVVRRIFAEHVAGRSLAAIASGLNADGVTPPRSSRRLRAPSWQVTTVRSMLHNPRYRGVLTFGERTWRKVPDTQLRRPKMRAPHEVVRLERPELRIVDEETWLAANPERVERQARAAQKRGEARRAYLFSGLLRCGACGASMQIRGGSSRMYYRCGDASARGTCSSTVSVAEDVVRTELLAAIAERVWSPATSAAIRAIVDEVLARNADRSELDAARRSLAASEIKIARLTDALAGDHGAAPAAVLGKLRELEADARSTRARIVQLELVARTDGLPSADEVLERTRELARGLGRIDRVDVARDRLRALLRGPVVLTQDGDHVVARTELLPAVLLGEALGAMRRGHCGGGVRTPRLAEPHGIRGLPIERRLPIARRAA